MQPGGGSQYGVSPEMTQFAASTGRTHMLGISTSEHLQQQQPQQPLVEDASPISSRPPARNFEELVPVTNNFPDEDALAGEEAERGTTGNRWPRQETLALLKIRSEMDAVFRDATLKGPLWEDVSRKLAELGYIRSAKKCKEKFENVHKYYKRTKEGRAGRQAGKSYRFYSQLEALHSTSAAAAAAAAAAGNTALHTPSSNPLAATPISVGINPIVESSGRLQPALPSAPSAQLNMPRMIPDLTAGPSIGVSASGAAGGISFSSNSSSSEDDSEEEIMEEGGPSMETRKRKRPSGSGSGNRKMMAFFEGLMKQVMERQEAMQQRFLETIERREQDRMIREEAWKRQEMARLSREHELMAQERAMAASRDTAVIAFLQKVTGQTIQIPAQAITAVAIPAVTPPPPPTQQQHHHQHHQTQLQQQPQQQPSQTPDIVRHHLPSSSSEVIPLQDQLLQQHEIVTTGSFDPASSRWPKTEVHALIKLRSGLEEKYQEAGPKGPLWEEISTGMQRMGYNRSSKRCKEKWENINKYFKKVKESNKKRPEDAKTCPYFHQLDALYRKKILSGGGGGNGNGSGGSSSAVPGTQSKQEQGIEQNPPNPNPSAQERSDVLAIMPPQGSTQTQTETDVKTSSNNNDNNNNSGGNTDGSSTGGSSLQVQTSNGGLTPSLFEEGAIKKKTL
ncbi:trihelix transcription factor GTL1-like isoform X2 [Aristolochia californica]|uniref:trihelix transcription factor GTL1-like isoform X2 n=1 Tax=Aristolochia californica TaxID=171875 RepID=UPI0035E0AA85